MKLPIWIIDNGQASGGYYDADLHEWVSWIKDEPPSREYVGMVEVYPEMKSGCRCCECQGKKCFMAHPGHSCGKLYRGSK